MYAGYGFRKFEIGDVDVLFANGKFHLFHLVLPNHDYIAHAVSEDGLAWQRVENALFIGQPGDWDDDMLWTMHVSPNPHVAGEYRMFYTGLSMREEGRVQRVGMARSRDLHTWTKETNGYPLELGAEHYENSLDEGRHWVSFRDPFYTCVEGQGYLLAAARVNEGPVIRRGCAALLKETAPDQFELSPPLHHPGRYDDFEVPGTFELGGATYLIGSIREDVKVHYWQADSFDGEYQNFSDNVLLPRGNYAARVCRDEARVLVWNFYIRGKREDTQHLLPPPKEIVRAENGNLRLKSYKGFDETVYETLELSDIAPLEPQFNPERRSAVEGNTLNFGCTSGFELFLLKGAYNDYRLTGNLSLKSEGKCGLVLHADGDNAYYISLDVHKGLAQIRYWAANPNGTFQTAFIYEPLQEAYYIPGEAPHAFSLITFGSYIELSVDGYVRLTLADDGQLNGRVGFYTESAFLNVTDLSLDLLECPKDSPYVSQRPVENQD